MFFSSVPKSKRQLKAVLLLSLLAFQSVSFRLAAKKIANFKAARATVQMANEEMVVKELAITHPHDVNMLGHLIAELHAAQNEIADAAIKEANVEEANAVAVSGEMNNTAKCDALTNAIDQTTTELIGLTPAVKGIFVGPDNSAEFVRVNNNPQSREYHDWVPLRCRQNKVSEEKAEKKDSTKMPEKEAREKECVENWQKQSEEMAKNNANPDGMISSLKGFTPLVVQRGIQMKEFKQGRCQGDLSASKERLSVHLQATETSLKAALAQEGPQVQGMMMELATTMVPHGFGSGHSDSSHGSSENKSSAKAGSGAGAGVLPEATALVEHASRFELFFTVLAATLAATWIPYLIGPALGVALGVITIGVLAFLTFFGLLALFLGAVLIEKFLPPVIEWIGRMLGWLKCFVKHGLTKVHHVFTQKPQTLWQDILSNTRSCAGRFDPVSETHRTAAAGEAVGAHAA